MSKTAQIPALRRSAPTPLANYRSRTERLNVAQKSLPRSGGQALSAHVKRPKVTDALYVRFTEGTKDRIERIAALERRTPSNWARVVIEMAIEQHEAAQAQAGNGNGNGGQKEAA